MRYSMRYSKLCSPLFALGLASSWTSLAGCGDDSGAGTETTSSGASTTAPTSTGTDAGTDTASGTGDETEATGTGTGTGTGTDTATDSDTGSTTGAETGGVGGVLSCPALPDGCGEVDVMTSAQWDGENYGADGICVFERLRDVANGVAEAAPVVLRTGVGLTGDSPSYTYLVLREDGTVLTQRSGSENGGESYVDPVMSCSLSEASYFEACLMTPSIGCLEIDSWTTGCAEVASFSCPG